MVQVFKEEMSNNAIVSNLETFRNKFASTSRDTSLELMPQIKQIVGENSELQERFLNSLRDILNNYIIEIKKINESSTFTEIIKEEEIHKKIKEMFVEIYDLTKDASIITVSNSNKTGIKEIAAVGGFGSLAGGAITVGASIVAVVPAIVGIGLVIADFCVTNKTNTRDSQVFTEIFIEQLASSLGISRSASSQFDFNAIPRKIE